MVGIKKGRKRKISEGKWESIIEKELVTYGQSARDRIFASSAGLCARQTAGLSQLPEGHSSRRQASTQFYFKIGSAFEEVVARAFESANMLIDQETRVEAYHPELPISGRIDFIIRDRITEEMVLVELKSCGKLPTSPRPAHLAQTQVYMALTGMPKALVWYISRSVAGWDGELQQKVFEVQMSETERRDVILTMAIGAVYAKHGFLPEIPTNMKQYKCGFCPLQPMCWDETELELVWLDPKTKHLHPTRTPDLDKRLELLKEAEDIAEDVMDAQWELAGSFAETMKDETWMVRDA